MANHFSYCLEGPSKTKRLVMNWEAMVSLTLQENEWFAR